MNRPKTYLTLAGCLALLTAAPSWGQGQSAPAPSAPVSQPSGAGGGNRSSTRQPSNQPSNNNSQMPTYVEGQIIDENGHPPVDRMSVNLSCGMRTLQSVRTDIRGYFRFTLGLNNQANSDFSAADEFPSASSSMGDFGLGSSNGFPGMTGTGNSLTGCEIRLSTPGYVPIDMPITDTASLGTFDVGVLELRRIGTVPTGSVSATSLLVPNNARKEYEQGVKDLQNKRLPQAIQHLQRAVGTYDKYATAWMELGRAYSMNHDRDKALDAFHNSVAADAKFAPPYVSLGALQLEDRDYQGALENIDKAVELDPAITTGVAGYIQGVAHFQLDHPDAAIASLLEAEKGNHAATPQLHVILAELYLRRDDSSTAATHLRAYLKEAPQGSFAAQMRSKLDEIDQAASNKSGGNSVIAP
jgi:tetratricopeptide (TPR) repeat protein